MLTIGADLVKAIYSYHRQYIKKDIDESAMKKFGLFSIDTVIDELNNDDKCMGYGD